MNRLGDDRFVRIVADNNNVEVINNEVGVCGVLLAKMIEFGIDHFKVDNNLQSPLISFALKIKFNVMGIVRLKSHFEPYM